eukprot:2402534-Pleurochrysis_carterae.AAC.1
MGGDCAPRCRMQERARLEGGGGDCAPRCRTQERAECEGRGGDCAPRCNTPKRAKCKIGAATERRAAARGSVQ